VWLSSKIHRWWGLLGRISSVTLCSCLLKDPDQTAGAAAILRWFQQLSCCERNKKVTCIYACTFTAITHFLANQPRS